jgi:hypothetical protein
VVDDGADAPPPKMMLPARPAFAREIARPAASGLAGWRQVMSISLLERRTCAVSPDRAVMAP